MNPFTVAELDAALAAIGGFEPRPLIAVGVSGGPDSLALAILADRWARQRGGTAWALIVDHGLRAESTAEARTVSGWLAGRGIPHAVLAWRDAKPATGIQEAAREARYRLLGAWCAAGGCLHVLTGHHREDQVETHLIRRRAGSGIDGLAGMSSVRELSHVRLVRPLLGVAKARLAAFLDAERQPYLLDPSNRNPAFERARLRMAMASPQPPALPACGEGDGRVATSASAEIRRCAAARIAREHELAALLGRAVCLHPAGFAVIDPTPLADNAEGLGERALGRIAAVLGGAAYPLRRERLARLRRALAEAPAGARTLGGCRFIGWRGRVLALREAARVAPPVRLVPGGSALWDRRFYATLPAVAQKTVIVGAVGAEGVAALGRAAVDDANPLPRLLYPVLPAIWDEAGLAAVPHLGWRRPTAGCMPQLAFRPAVPLLATGFTVV